MKNLTMTFLPHFYRTLTIMYSNSPKGPHNNFRGKKFTSLNPMTVDHKKKYLYDDETLSIMRPKITNSVDYLFVC